jgi:hypothetical protein
MKKNRTYYRMLRCLFLFVLGAGALVYSHFSYVKYNKNEELIKVCTLKVDAPINKVEYYEETEKDEDGIERTVMEHYKVFFTYEVSGQKYSGDYTSSSSYKEGDNFTLFCNPDNPNVWISKTDVWYQEYILKDDVKGVRKVGIAFIVIGALMSIFYITKGVLGKSKRTNDKKESDLKK